MHVANYILRHYKIDCYALTVVKQYHVDMTCVAFLLVEEPKGIDYLWFIGDNFTAKSYRAHFKLNAKQHFIMQNFEFTAFVNSKFSSSNGNMLARLQNTFASALNQSKKSMLPKYVVIVLDNDLITYLNFNKEGAATLMVLGLNGWLSNLKSCLLQGFLNYLQKPRNLSPFSTG